MPSAPINCRSKDVRIAPVVVSELKLRDVQRHIFRTHLVERTDATTFEDRPETLNRVRVNRTNNILLAMVIDRLPIVFGQSVIDAAFVSGEQTDFLRNHFAHEILTSRAADMVEDAGDHVALALYGTDDGGFGRDAMLARPALTTVPMFVLVLSADGNFHRPLRCRRVF
jgi:hypothetical protein